MHPRIAFYRKKDFGDNVEEEMLSILLDDIGYMKGGFERKRPLSVPQHNVKPLDSGLTYSMAKKWTNYSHVSGVNTFCIFPVYADEDMLSETATHMLSNEGRGLEDAAIKAIDFNPRIISVEVVGKEASHSETVQVENIPARKGLFRFKRKRDRNSQLCEIKYLTQPIEGAKPIGAITIIPPRGHMFSGVVWE